MSRGPTIYWRARGGVRRAYADLRAYADVGGTREALVAQGEKLATADPAIAQTLLARRIAQLDASRRGRTIHGLVGQTALEGFARAHLQAKARSGKVTEDWLEQTQQHLERAAQYFGPEKDLAEITTADVRRWCEYLQERLSGGTVRHHLNALSNLYKRARAEGVVPPGYDPTGDLQEKPVAATAEARWLEVHDAALLFEAARTYLPKPNGGRPPLPFGYELIATFLLTGGRESEVLGLEVADVSLDRGVVTFRPNGWRRLKTKGSYRSLALWPQLRTILENYLAARPPSRLLFPSYRTGVEAMVTDFHKLLDAVAERAGWKAGEVRSKMFRHTYITARLQTLDRGAPVSAWTVAREVGHRSTDMIEEVYGHLGDVRHRSEVVEYRVEQHAAKLGERLATLNRLSLAPPLTPRG